MQFKANCQRRSKDSICVEHIGTDEVYIGCTYGDTGTEADVILSKEDALALASTIINHYRVAQNGS